MGANEGDEGVVRDTTNERFECVEDRLNLTFEA
jgi:hypothetical protein